MDARVRCLDRRLGALDATLGQLRHATPGVLGNLDSMLGELPSLAPCSNTDYVLAAGSPPDPSIADDVARRQEELAELTAQMRAGEAPDGLPRLQALQVVADELGYPALQADVALALAARHRVDADGESQRTRLEEAMTTAAASGEDTLVAEIATRLAAASLGADDEGRSTKRWLAFAEAFGARVGAPISLARRRQQTRAALAQSLGEFERARDEWSDLIARIEAEDGASSPELVSALGVRSTVFHRLGALSEMAGDAERAAEIARSEYGDSHPTVARATIDWANASYLTGDQERAIERWLEARDIYQRAYGPRHARLITPLMNVGSALAERGDLKRGLPYLRDAIEMTIELDGPRAKSLFVMYNNLAGFQIAEGKIADAEATYTSAVALFDEGKGPMRLATPLMNLGDLARRRGDLDAAERHISRAERVLARQKMPDNLNHAQLAAKRAILTYDQGRRAEAREAIDAAHRLAHSVEMRARDRGAIMLELGMTLWRDRQHARARSVLAEARRDLAEAGGGRFGAELDAFLTSERVGPLPEPTATPAAN
jgi:tetratricopeptide (TPR) repeat protein